MTTRSLFKRFALLSVLMTSGIALAADWPTAGHDLKNSRYQPDETAITTNTVGQLGNVCKTGPQFA